MWSPSGITGPTLIRRFGLMMSDLQGLITKSYIANLSTHYYTCVSTPIFSLAAVAASDKSKRFQFMWFEITQDERKSRQKENHCKSGAIISVIV